MTLTAVAAGWSPLGAQYAIVVVRCFSGAGERAQASNESLRLGTHGRLCQSFDFIRKEILLLLLVLVSFESSIFHGKLEILGQAK